MRWADLSLSLEGNGPVFLSGENGAGKSSILDSLLFTIYGTTARGVSADDVISRGAASCSCAVRLRSNGYCYEVRRERSRSGGGKLTLLSDSKDITAATAALTQERIDAILGLSKDEFLTTCTFSADARFASLTDAERKRLLERLLGLEIFEAALAEARERQRVLGDALRRAREGLTRCDEEIREQTDAQAVLETKIRERVKSAKADRKELEVKRAELDKKLEPLRKLPSLDGESEARQRLAALHDEVAKLEAAARAEPGLEKIEAEAGRVRSKKRCTLCGQSVEGESLAKAQEGLRRKIEEAKKIEADAQEAREKLPAVRLAALKQGEKVDAFTVTRSDSKERSALREALGQVEKRLEALDGPAPELALLENIKRRLEVLVGSRRSSEDSAKEFEQAERRAAFWVEGFGLRGLRSLALDEAIPRLETLANDAARELCGSRARISIRSTSETAKGAVRDVLDVGFEMDDGGASVRSCSGGERTRLDVAFAVGLLELMRERRGSPGLVFLDEVFERLDPEGCEAVAKLIRDRARRWGKVFVISHLPELAALFPQSLAVVKRDGISVLED